MQVDYDSRTDLQYIRNNFGSQQINIKDYFDIR